jgi:hypothetical protein
MRYSIDFARLNTPNKKPDTLHILEGNDIPQLCNKLIVNYPYPRAKSCGYNSRIDVAQPDANFFSELARCGELNARLTYIEIAEDEVCENEEEAIQKFHDIQDKIYLNNGAGFQLRFLAPEIKNGFFYDKTTYIGRYRSFQIVIYLRYSKVDGKPVLRKEFRIWGNAKIKSKLKIADFHEINDPKKLYKLVEKNSLRSGELDQKKVARMLQQSDKPINIVNLNHFQKYLVKEKIRLKNARGGNKRYQKLIRNRFSYFLK